LPGIWRNSLESAPIPWNFARVIFTRSATSTLNGHFASWLYDLSPKVVVGLNLLRE
jgi:hypothetical protein